MEENFPLEPSSPNAASDDKAVKKLEAFFSQNEHPFCEISMKLSLDGLQLNIFSDTEEVDTANQKSSFDYLYNSYHTVVSGSEFSGARSEPRLVQVDDRGSNSVSRCLQR